MRHQWQFAVIVFLPTLVAAISLARSGLPLGAALPMLCAVAAGPLVGATLVWAATGHLPRRTVVKHMVLGALLVLTYLRSTVDHTLAGLGLSLLMIAAATWLLRDAIRLREDRRNTTARW